MTLDQYKERYAGLKSAAVRSLIKTDASFRKVTEDLYVEHFHQNLNKTCSDCWMDAYILLMKSDIDKLMERKERKFELLNGALLRDTKGGDSTKLCSAHNLTDELALYHLSVNPACHHKFARLPENWEELVEEYKAKNSPAKSKKDKDNTEDSPEVANAKKAVKTASAAVKTSTTLLAKAEKSGDEEKIANLKARLEKHKEELAFAESALAELVGE